VDDFSLGHFLIREGGDPFGKYSIENSKNSGSLKTFVFGEPLKKNAGIVRQAAFSG